MIAFLDGTTYYFGFIVLVIIFTIILNFKKTLLFTYQKQIALFFASLQMFLFLINIFMSIIKQEWWRLLLHDLCPIVSFTSIIVFIIDQEKGYKSLMPWFLIGSTITIFTGAAPFYSNPEYLLSFFEHMTMLAQGVFAYIWVKKYQKNDFLKILILPIFLIIWNFITGFTPWQISENWRWVDSSNGMFIPSIQPGKNFEILGMITFVPYPLPLIIFYTLAVCLAYLICFNKNNFSKYYDKFKKIIKKSKKLK